MLRTEQVTGSGQIARIPALATAFAVALIAMSALYLVLAVAPFYLHGIDRHSYAEIFGSAVDVKGYAPFSWPGVGPLFQMGAMLSVFLVRVFCPVMCGALAITGWLGWRWSAPAARVIWLVAGTAALVLTLVSWTTQDIILVWLAD
ncbi:MAG: hypothetical protein QOH93_49 [Chloroflexia bacterium]|jgi:hypothetical protein|nr:hypothetical protein [Chloroflexia bacterium]